MKESVDAVNKLAKSGEITDESLARMERDADKAALSLLKLASEGKLASTELGKAEKQVKDLRDSLVELGAASKLTGVTGATAGLDAEMARVKTRMHELATEFRNTGSPAALAGFRDAERELHKLETIAKDVGQVLSFGVPGAAPGKRGFFGRLIDEGKSAGKDFGDAFEGGFLQFLMSPAGLGALGFLAIPAANAIGGALLLGVGGGAIATGIIAQLHDPKVTAAAQHLGKDLSTGLKDATSDFAAPMTRALGIFDSEWKQLQPGLKSTFKELAPEVDHLAVGGALFVDNLAGGLERAAVASKPLLHDFSGFLATEGRQLGALFDTAATHAGAAQQGMRLVEDSVVGLTASVRIAIPYIAGLGTAFSYLQAAGIGEHAASWFYGQQAVDSAHVSVQAFSVAALGSVVALTQQADAEKKAAQSAYALSQAMDKAFNTQLSLSQATGNWVHDLANLKGQLDLHDRKLKETTDAGHQNADALRHMADEAERVRQATIDAAGGENASQAAVDAANKKFNDQVKALIAMAIHLGLGADAVHRLLDPYLKLANAPNISKTISVNYVTHGGNPSSPYYYKPMPQEHGGIQHFAGGGMFRAGDAGIVYGGGPYAMFGEPGTGASTEGFLPKSGIPHMAAGGLLSEMASWYGYGVTDRRMPSGGGSTNVVMTVQVTGNGSGWFMRAVREGEIQLFANGQPVTTRSGR